MPSSRLPLDIYIHILHELDDSYDRTCDASVKVLSGFLQSNTVLREAASVASIWRPHYLHRYLHCDISQELLRKEIHGGDWRLMYADRRRLDRNALLLLDQVVSKRQGRFDIIKELLSLDLWDALELECCYYPKVFREEGGDAVTVESASPSLTRRFWAQSVLNVIARKYAIDLWGRAFVSVEGSIGFEEAFSALSCFHGKLPAEISTSLDQLGTECRDFLSPQLDGQTLNLDNNNSDVQHICLRICHFMNARGFGGANPSNFYHIMNHFPHSVLSTNKQTIPISLVHVFVAISRRLGITASPVALPSKVLALVPSPDGDIYVDVYDSVILSASDDILPALLTMGVEPSSALAYLSAGTTSALLLRAARNIFASSRRLITSHHLSSATEIASQELISSLLCAICIHVIGTSDPNPLSLLSTEIGFRLLDFATLPDLLAPLIQGRCKEILNETCRSVMQEEADTAAIVRLRSPSAVKTKYFVGMMVKHLTGYSGVIIGWEPTCGMSEEWMQSAGVDLLPRGRNQPFYTVLCVGGPPRCVAEDLIQPVDPTRSSVETLFEQMPSSAVYFEGAELHEDTHGRGRLLLSPDLRATYPEDDDVGRSWVLNGATQM